MKKVRLLAFIIVITIMLSLCACTNVKKADALLENGIALLHKQNREQPDISEALECFEQAAALGNDDACFLAGWTLSFETLPQTSDNYKKAYDYYQKCCSSNPYALIAEGLLYIEGIAFEADEEKALNLINKGINEIDEESLVDTTNLSYYSEALNLLGILYLSSYEVDEDCEKAVSYFQKGANLNNTKSLVYTGYMYLNGWGVKTDYLKAMDYFHKANNNAGKEALYYLGYMYHEGLGVEADSTQAFEYYLEAAKAGHIYSMIEVSSAYTDGDGVDADQEQSEQWYAKAIAAGYKD